MTTCFWIVVYITVRCNSFPKWKAGKFSLVLRIRMVRCGGLLGKRVSGTMVHLSICLLRRLTWNHPNECYLVKTMLISLYELGQFTSSIMKSNKCISLSTAIQQHAPKWYSEVRVRSKKMVSKTLHETWYSTCSMFHVPVLRNNFLLLDTPVRSNTFLCKTLAINPTFVKLVMFLLMLNKAAFYWKVFLIYCHLSFCQHWVGSAPDANKAWRLSPSQR